MFTPDTFVTACKDCVNGGGVADDIERIVREALRSQAQDPTLWHGDELMYRSPGLTVVNLALPGRARTPIHDHGVWAVIGISVGCEIDRFYRVGPDGLTPAGHVEVHSGQTVCLAVDVIHAIENPGAQVARGLHVYGGDLAAVARRMWDPRTQRAVAFHPPTFEQWGEELSAAEAPNLPPGERP